MSGTSDVLQPGSASTQKAPIFKFVIFCFMWSGLNFTEFVSANLLPITIGKFTENAAYLGWILAINPAFGFIAQPIVGIMSDRIWTSVGRRAFFLITGAPIVAICLCLAPELQIFWQLIVIIVIWQFFQDVLWGSDHPLMADLFTPQQRLLLAGFLAATAEVSKIIFLQVFMVFFEVEEIYRMVAIIQVFFVAGAAFMLGERKKTNKAPKLNVSIYFKDIFHNPYLRKFALLNFSKMFFLVVINGYMIKFAMALASEGGLGLSKAEYGLNWGFQAYISLGLSIPLGIIVERYFAKNWALAFGYVLCLTGCVYGFFANEASDLIVVAIFMGVGIVIDAIVRKPFFTEFLPPDKIGQLTGALNIFLGAGRMAAYGIGGTIIAMVDNNWRFIFVMGFIMGVITLVTAIRIPDLRYQQKKVEDLLGS